MHLWKSEMLTKLVWTVCLCFCPIQESTFLHHHLVIFSIPPILHGSSLPYCAIHTAPFVHVTGPTPLCVSLPALFPHSLTIHSSGSWLGLGAHLPQLCCVFLQVVRRCRQSSAPGAARLVFSSFFLHSLLFS